MVIQRADIFRNRHLIVVQHNQHIRADIARMVHGFKCHPGGNRAIANHADGAALFAFFRCGNGNANARADGCGGVTDA
jgi:hypothetical protein